MATISGFFGFVQIGRWLQGFAVLEDGTFTDRHGVAIDPIALDATVLSVRAVASAVIDSGKRTRLDVVNASGLTLPALGEKGCFTLERGITNRIPKKAALVIAAIEAQQEVQKAA